MRESQVSFIRQMGFAAEDANQELYSALMLQPRAVGVIVGLGIITQSPLLFYGLLLRRLQAGIVERERGTRWLRDLVVGAAR